MRLLLVEEDVSNLHDFFCMVESEELVNTLKLNGLFVWHKKFFRKLEGMACPELYKREKK